MLDLRIQAGFHPEQSNARGLKAVADELDLTTEQVEDQMAQYFDELYDHAGVEEPALKTNNGNGNDKEKTNNGQGNQKEKTNNAGGKKK